MMIGELILIIGILFIMYMAIKPWYFMKLRTEVMEEMIAYNEYYDNMFYNIDDLNPKAVMNHRLYVHDRYEFFVDPIKAQNLKTFTERIGEKDEP